MIWCRKNENRRTVGLVATIKCHNPTSNEYIHHYANIWIIVKCLSFIRFNLHSNTFITGFEIASFSDSYRMYFQHSPSLNTPNIPNILVAKWNEKKKHTAKKLNKKKNNSLIWHMITVFRDLLLALANCCCICYLCLSPSLSHNPFVSSRTFLALLFFSLIRQLNHQWSTRRASIPYQTIAIFNRKLNWTHLRNHL